jgi:catechol 2,3-dioxygenase-like lactoylglutathione lyase family enzyme
MVSGGNAPFSIVASNAAEADPRATAGLPPGSVRCLLDDDVGRQSHLQSLIQPAAQSGTENMQLVAIRIFVDDLTAARRFYQETLGLPLAWDEEDSLGFDVGGNLIVESVPRSAKAEDRALVGRFVGCSLEVNNVEKACKALSAKGVVFTGPPERQPWGGTLAHFKDPSGNILTLVEI